MRQDGSTTELTEGGVETVTPDVATVEVVKHEEVGHAWKCPGLSAGGMGGAHDAEFRAGTVLRLDGREHLLRRRSMGDLLKRRGHERFRDQWLYPTANEALQEALRSPAEDGWVHLDLHRWGRRVNQ